MQYDILIKEEARADALAAWLYYEGKQQGLGERFLEMLETCFKKIGDNPQYYSYLRNDKEKTLRRKQISGFPYNIVYEVIDEKVIVYMIHNSYRSLL